MATVTLAVDDVEFDTENPRYEAQQSQFEALEAIVRDQGKKLLKLVQHIGEHGLNPTELLAVVPNGGGKFGVVEGNRRLAALKFLRKPSIVAGLTAPEKLKRALHDAATKGHSKVPSSIECARFPDRDSARIWIELKHTGENAGAGVVPWDGVQTARFRGDAASLSVLGYAQKQNLIDSDQVARFPISTLDRLLGDPAVRGAVGLNVSGGRVTSSLEPAEVKKGLRRIIKDLSSGKVTVSHLKGKKDRAKYVASWAARDRPNLGKGAPSWQLGDQSQVGSGGGKAPSAPKRGPRSAARKYLIPSDYNISIPEIRLQQICKELRSKLPMRETPNAVVVLLRVFIELSTDLYLERNRVPVNDPKTSHPLELGKKITAAADHLVAQNKVRKSALHFIRRATSAPHSSTSVTTFHAFVHNRKGSPIPSELPDFWSHFEPYITALYS